MSNPYDRLLQPWSGRPFRHAFGLGLWLQHGMNEDSPSRAQAAPGDSRCDGARSICVWPRDTAAWFTCMPDSLTLALRRTACSCSTSRASLSHALCSSSMPSPRSPPRQGRLQDVLLTRVLSAMLAYAVVLLLDPQRATQQDAAELDSLQPSRASHPAAGRTAVRARPTSPPSTCSR